MQEKYLVISTVADDGKCWVRRIRDNKVAYLKYSWFKQIISDDGKTYFVANHTAMSLRLGYFTRWETQATDG